MSAATRRLYRTADDQVVGEGDPAARFLLAGVGDEIPDGYEDPSPVVKEAEPAEDKQAEPADDKADEPETDKATKKAPTKKAAAKH